MVDQPVSVPGMPLRISQTVDQNLIGIRNVGVQQPECVHGGVIPGRICVFLVDRPEGSIRLAARVDVSDCGSSVDFHV